ncbi:MAG: Ig family protein [Bryobacterales bacterium]|nr:Ig family protein [Bryobacterales bacterium]
MRLATISALLLCGGWQLAMAQTPVQITAICPNTLSASASYQGVVTVNIFGTGFTPTTRIASNHPAFINDQRGYRYISPTQMAITLLGTGLSAPGAIVLTAFDERPDLTITTPSLSDGTIGRAYSTPLAATGGEGPYTWSAAGLPLGLAVVSSNDFVGITGTTQEQGTFRVTVSVKDSANPAQTTSKLFDFTMFSNIGALPLRAQGGDARDDTAFRGRSAATGTLIASRLQNRLRPGITVTSNTVTLPVIAAPVLTSLSPAQTTVTADLTLSIAGGQFSNSSQACPAGTPGITLIWNGNPIAASVAITPQLLTATIPNALLANAGTVTVAVESAVGIRSNALPLLINPRPAITTTSLPPAVAGTVYPGTVVTRIGGTPPFTWSLAPAGAGLSIDGNGVVSGAIPAPGNLPVQITVRDAAGIAATAALNIVVVSVPSISFAGVPNPILSLDQQNTLTVTLAEPSPEVVSGTLSLQFQVDPAVTSNRGAIDPLVSLATTQFTITPPSTTARIGLQAGLTAGTLTITATDLRVRGFPVTPTVIPTFTTRIAPAPPVVQEACIAREQSNGLGLTGLNVRVTGFSDTRELTRARFVLSGNKLGTTELALNNAAPIFGTYYDTHFVSFLYQQKIQVTGDPNDISDIAVVLENTQGASSPFRAKPTCP